MAGEYSTKKSVDHLSGNDRPVIGELDTAAATGVVTTTDKMMAYIKQLVTNSESAADAIELLTGLVYYAEVTTYTDTTHFSCASLIDFGGDFFAPSGSTPYYVYVLWDAGLLGAAPQGELRAISGFVSAVGTFVHAAFTAPVAIGDKVLIIHPLIASLGMMSDAAATGAVTTTDFMMGYMKQLVTEGIARDAVVGALADTIPAMNVGPSGAMTLIMLCGAVLERLGATPADSDDSALTILGQQDATIPAMNTAPSGSLSLVQLAGAILERLGATPADSDDSVHTILGQRDNAADTGATTGAETVIGLLRQLVTNQLLVVHGPMDFWSDLDAVLTIDAAAGDENLPDVVVGDLPTGATVVRCIPMFKYSKRFDSSSADNMTEDAQIISVDSAVGRDSVVTGINLPDDSFHTLADATEGGDVIIGDNDVASEVTGNATYYITWELADAHGGDLIFYDVQVGLRIWYTVE